MIRIDNRGPRVASSNYWAHQMARDGYVYLSANAGAWRLLVPEGCAIHRNSWGVKDIKEWSFEAKNVENKRNSQ